MLKNIAKLEKQVLAVSLENRVRRRNIVSRCYLLSDAMISTATKPTVLGGAVLVGFFLGLRENRKPTIPRSSRAVTAQILSLAINSLTPTIHCDK